MRTRQPPPRRWLVTDERGGDLLAAMARLPRGAGVLFRHHATAPAARRGLFAAVRRIARARRLVLVLADTAATASAWRADGVHGGTPRRRHARPLLRSAAAHDARELVAAGRARADLVFLSPVYPTRSHPGEAALGRARFRALARRTTLPVVALGGMNERRARALRGAVYGWAGIDAWARRQPNAAAMPPPARRSA